jgi:hypothetical protein
MMDRIIGAFTFKQGVYNEVKSDTSFTQNAWIIVVVATLLAQLGINSHSGIAGLLIGAILGTIFGVGGFALTCYVVPIVAKALFQVTTTFDELVRVIGLAYVWYVVGVLAFVLGFFGSLAGLLVLVAIVFAFREILGLDWVKAIVIAVIAGVVVGVVTVIAGVIVGVILGILGLGAAIVAG